MIKTFYNLAFVLSYMATQSRVTSKTLFSSFEPSDNNTGTIELANGMIRRTIRRDRCESDGDYKRLVEIYKTLPTLRTNTLQSVESAKQSRFPSRKIVVLLSPMGFYRLPENTEEVEAWLENTLDALQAWHASGYCLGVLGRDNMAYIPQHQLTKDEVVKYPGYWVLDNMESSRWSRAEFPVATPTSVDSGELLSARDKSMKVTAKKVLVMLNQTKNCRAEDLQTAANMILSALHSPEMTPELMLVMLEETVPPPQASEPSS